MFDHFTAWMSGLDPVEVAKTNSFHSAAHKAMVDDHAHKKTLLALGLNPLRLEVKEAFKNLKLHFNDQQLEQVRLISKNIYKKENTNVR